MLNKLKYLFIKGDESSNVNDEQNQIVDKLDLTPNLKIFKKKYIMGDGVIGLQDKHVPFLLSQWLVTDKSKVKSGEKIIKYELANSEDGYFQVRQYETAPLDGIIIHIANEKEIIKEDESIYAIEPIDVSFEDVIQRIHSSKIVGKEFVLNVTNGIMHRYLFNEGDFIEMVEINDDFDGQILSTKDIDLKTINHSHDYKLNFKFSKAKTSLRLIGYRKHQMLKVNDKIEFILSNNSRLKFKFKNKPKQINKSPEGIVIENNIVLSISEINQFKNFPPVNWRIISNSGNEEIRGMKISDQVEFQKEIYFSLKLIDYKLRDE